MSDHLRKQIRDAVKAKLMGLATTGNRVFIGRTRPLAAGHEPTLLIYTRDEQSEAEEQGSPRPLMRDVQLFVDGRVTASAPPDNLLDQIALEVETALGGETLNGLAWDLLLRSTSAEVVAQGEEHVGMIRIEYRVLYRAIENAPAAPI